ncbi:MAG: hypothetical protein ACRD3B_13485 [Candidatus Sulfotelmatobacter sp.]
MSALQSRLHVRGNFPFRFLADVDLPGLRWREVHSVDAGEFGGGVIVNFSLLLYAIAKAGMMCGLLPGIAIAILLERFRVTEFGVETSSGGEQLAEDQRNWIPGPNPIMATSSPRKVRCA